VRLKDFARSVSRRRDALRRSRRHPRSDRSITFEWERTQTASIQRLPVTPCATGS